MQSLSRTAQLYMLLCLLGGTGAAIWLGLSTFQVSSLGDWMMGAVLAAVAAICQVFVIKRVGTDHSDHLTQAPLFAAMLLLPRPVVACVVLIAFLPEWYVYRRKWFIQLFNIASYFVAAGTAYLVCDAVVGRPLVFSTQPADWYVMVVLGVVFLLVQTLLVSLVLLLARGQSFRESRLFAPTKLGVEAALLAIGTSFALCWLVAPAFGLIAAAPLLLIFRALHVPNLIEEAATDAKTGLANMRHFNNVIQRDLERAERNGHHASLLMCDLDFLRNINNTFGHQAGDIVLLGIADIIRRAITGKDIAARFGGEEFLIFLSDSEANVAHELAERIRSELELTEFDGGPAGPLRATISIGVATFPHDGRTTEMLTREADLAVYQAKREGRNRVSVAGRTSRELAGEWAREHLVGPVIATPVAEVPAPRWKLISEVTRDRINSETTAIIGKPGKTRRFLPAAAKAKTSSSNPTTAMYLLIAAVFLGGVVSVASNLTLVGVQWWGLLLFVALTAITEQFAVDTGGRGKTSVAIVSVLAAAFLFGSVGVAVTALALALSVAIKARSRPERVLFNIGIVLLSGQGAYLVFTLFAPIGLSAATFPRTILPAMAAGLTYYAINHALLCGIRGLHERRSPKAIWQADYRWLWPHYIVLGALALVVALGNLILGGIGVVALMAPVGMMHLAIAQFMAHTKLHLDELQRMNGRLTDSYEATLQALSRALDTRDEETEEHSQRVKQYTGLMATHLGVPDDQREDMLRGALLHDIGKIGVPDAILLKPGRLTPEEITIMRKHPEIGYGMIAHIPFLSNAAQVVLHHHEAYDGGGYPSGLAGAAIPLGARIFAVADTFDAMTSDRPYRSALPVETAMQELRAFSGRQFDPAIVEAFMALPIADLLAVHNGKIIHNTASEPQVEPRGVLVPA